MKGFRWMFGWLAMMLVVSVAGCPKGRVGKRRQWGVSEQHDLGQTLVKVRQGEHTEALSKQATEAVVKGDWESLKAVAEKWLAQFGADPVEGLAKEAGAAYEAEERGDEEAARRHEEAMGRWVEQIRKMPDEWLVPAFLRWQSCFMLGEVMEASPWHNALWRVVSENKKRIEVVVAWAKEVVKGHPDSAMALVTLGLAYAWSERYDEAIASFNPAIALDSEFANAYLGRGDAYLAKGNIDRAIADFNRAIQIKPDDAEAYLKLALACQMAMKQQPKKREEYQRQAIEALNKFIELAPKQGWARDIPTARRMLKVLQGK